MNESYKHPIIVVLFGTLTLLAGACSHNVFDEDTYKELIKEQQPSDTIDAQHTWTLTATHTVYVDASSQRLGTERVQILTGNPTTDEDITIVADQPMADGQQKYVAFSAPVTLTTFYAALVDSQNRYTVQRFSVSGQNPQVSFASPIASQVEVGERQLNHLAYSYCFESEMPVPGDYDYNDVILRISQRQTASNQITLDVTLVAVGSKTKMAAAIRLLDQGYNDIVSIETADGERFDKGMKHTQNDMIGKDELLLQGLDGKAVVNLFEDAHWATGQVGYNDVGLVDRYYYNVSTGTSTEYDIIPPRTVSYVLTFRNESFLNYFTLESLDPFIIVSQGTVFLEVHSNFANRETPSLHDFRIPTSEAVLPWALVVPTNSFRHPLEGVNIGYYKDGALFGAFMTQGHAFGEWASNESISRDWYNFPTGNQVF